MRFNHCLSILSAHALGASKPERMIFLTDVEQPNGRPFAVEQNWLMRRRVRRN
jgi:hypothetical protein